jgi:cellulose synthase/poly-beta-1,6-N-acetylglucosamine synthase-like glycosyltransferase
MSLRYANITQASRKSRSNRIKTVVRTLSVISLLIIVFGKVIEPIEIDSITWLYGVFVTLLITIHFFTAYRYYRDPALDPVHPSVKNLEPRVSCVVAVKNEEKIIEQCVRSMLNQTYKNIEVVVTNDGSTDGTGPILDDLAAK